MLGDDLLEQLLNGTIELRDIAAGRLLEFRRDVVEALSDDRIEGHERPCNRLAGAHGSELKLVAGEGKRARPVAVAGMLRQRRQRVNAHGERAARLAAGRLPLLDLLEDI